MNPASHSGELLSEMIGLIYETASDLSLWPELLQELSKYLETTLNDGSAGTLSAQPDDARLIRLLSPHFERAHAINLHLIELEEERNLLENMMNRIPLGAAIIDAECTAVSLNRTFTSILQGNSILDLVDGKLVSPPPNVLQQTVDLILSGQEQEKVLRLEKEGAAISIWICRARTPARNAPIRLMMLVACRSSHALSEEGLVGLFGLTAAEARVTQQLALGHNLEESAGLLNITRNTTKKHLANIFRKVGVKRQADLIQAIYASPLWLQANLSQTEKFTPALIPVSKAHKESDDLRIRLADGRSLSFSDSGDPQGLPVILMHGIAGSRHLRHPDDEILLHHGIRLIIPDRPGSGDSTPLAQRSIADWPKDVAELAAQLGLKRFAVIGYSAGSAYALTTAAALPDQVSDVHIVAAVPPLLELEDIYAFSPLFRMTLLLARYTPSLLPSLMRLMVRDIRSNVYRYLESTLTGAPEQDREILCDSRLRSNIAMGMRASVKHGEHEIAQEVILSACDWGLDMPQVTAPVHIWHGEQDPLIAPSGARKLAAMLPDAQLKLIPEAGHYLLYSHWQELLSSIRGN